MPQTDRCSFNEGGERCRRIGFNTRHGQLCRRHAARIELELERGDPLDELINTVDRQASASSNPFVRVFAGVVGQLFGREAPREAPPQGVPVILRCGNCHQPIPRPGAHRQFSVDQPYTCPPRPRAAPPPRPQAREPDPLLAARELLGFEPNEKLTVELVQKRKQALARVFHPDMQGGSTARMTLINAAADRLLAKL
jgi:hypothetical protein